MELSITFLMAHILVRLCIEICIKVSNGQVDGDASGWFLLLCHMSEPPEPLPQAEVSLCLL